MTKASEHFEPYIHEALSKFFERLLKAYGDTPQIRLIIAQYTMGYMGAQYGIHIPQ